MIVPILHMDGSIVSQPGGRALQPPVCLSKSNTQHPDISVTIRFLIKANQKNDRRKNQPIRGTGTKRGKDENKLIESQKTDH